MNIQSKSQKSSQPQNHRQSSNDMNSIGDNQMIKEIPKPRKIRGGERKYVKNIKSQ